jgi:hypothetical protein
VSDRAGVLAELARAMAATQTDEALPVRLCRAYVEVLGAEGGAMTLASTSSERLTLSTSNGVSQQIEDLQDVLGEGPGQDAYRNGRAVVTTVDGSRAAAFPMFSEMAGALTGDMTVWAIPMHPGGTTIGVMTLYRRTGGLVYGLDDAQFLADSIGAALLDDPSAHALMPFVGWSDRARVHQATGMVVAQLGVGPEDALAILRAHAFADAVSLDRIAVEVLERRLNFMHTPAGMSSTEDQANYDSTQDGEP